MNIRRAEEKDIPRKCDNIDIARGICIVIEYYIVV